jgi:hypothetical protein
MNTFRAATMGSVNSALSVLMQTGRAVGDSLHGAVLILC